MVGWWGNVIAINRDVSTSWQTHTPPPLGLRTSSRAADEILPYLWPFQTPREPQIVSRRIFFYKNISTTFPILGRLANIILSSGQTIRLRRKHSITDIQSLNAELLKLFGGHICWVNVLAMSRTSSKSHLFKELSGAMERVPGWYCAPRLNVGNRIVINIHPTGFNYSRHHTAASQAKWWRVGGGW